MKSIISKFCKIFGRILIALSIAMTVITVLTCNGWTAVDFPSRTVLLITMGSAASLFVFGLVLINEHSNKS
jgi:hypothetical protein